MKVEEFKKILPFYIGQQFIYSGSKDVLLNDLTIDNLHTIDSDNDFIEIRLALFPMSHLIKQIQYKGSYFTPIQQLLEMCSNEPYGRINYKIVETVDWHATHKNDIDDFYGIKYVEDNRIILFGYSNRFHRFSHQELNPTRPFGTGYQLEMFMKLFDWGFDVFGLIEKGYAVDKTKLSIDAK